MYNKITETFTLFWESFIILIPNLLLAIFFLFVFYVMGRLAYSTFKKTIIKRSDDPFTIDFIGKVVKWIFYLIGTIVALHVMGFSGIANSILTGAGISALIVGFAFKDIFENILSGILLAINRPFNTGNVIEIAGFKGTVKGLDLRTTHIRNVEGKDIYIPNATMIKGALINYTKDGYLRLDFDIGMDVPTDLNQVKELILAYLQKQPEVLKKPEPNVLITAIASHTVDVKVLFWVNVLKDKSTAPSYLGITIKSKIIKEVKEILLENGINLPSPIVEFKAYEPHQPINIAIRN